MPDNQDSATLARENSQRITSVAAVVGEIVPRVRALEVKVENMAPKVDVQEAVGRMEVQLVQLSSAIAAATERAERDRKELVAQAERDRREYDHHLKAITDEVSKGMSRISAINEENMKEQAIHLKEKHDAEIERERLANKALQQELEARDAKIAEAAAKAERDKWTNKIKVWGATAAGVLTIISLAGGVLAFFLNIVLPIIQKAVSP